jgi:dTDP-4-amino-4,6-dideoxygalactose transaminase
MDSGVLTKGQYVSDASEIIKDQTKAKYVVMTSSGTAALHAIMVASGIDSNAQVFIPSLSWPSAANVAQLLGAEVVFVDCALDFNSHFEQFHKQYELYGDATCNRFWVPIHQFGIPVYDIEKIADFCEQEGICMIEDAACCYGGEINANSVGTFGVGGIFSFHPRKMITCGEGGAIVTNDESIYNICSKFVDHGSLRFAGLNYRMSELNAAMLCLQLKKIDEMIYLFQDIYETYQHHLSNTGIISKTHDTDTLQSLVLGPFSNRDILLKIMEDNEIECKVPSIVADSLEYFKYNFIVGECPVAEYINSHYMSVPYHSELSDDEIEKICSIIKEHINVSYV